MRWYILRTLLHKEALRHMADRGAIFLAMLLLGLALILSLFGKDVSDTGPMIGGVYVRSLSSSRFTSASPGSGFAIPQGRLSEAAY